MSASLWKLLAVVLLFQGLGAAQAEQRPNVLLIVADDLGYTDIGRFGSEIETPHIDGLADRGTVLTRFYVSPICSPTRAMLLTGVDNHVVGLGTMAEVVAENQLDKPGYEGHLNDAARTLPGILREAGYRTYIAGKWHLGSEPDLGPEARGFDRSFVLLNGGADHFDGMYGTSLADPVARYRADGERVESLPEWFYSSDYFTTRLIEFMHEDRDTGRPFFAMLSFSAPHWPVQAPDFLLSKYEGRYTAGWDTVRAQRFQKAKERGVIPGNAEMPPRPGWIPPWSELADPERERQARIMAAYAAMIDRMDHNVGRVLSYLQRSKLDDNTYVIFLSDNGADGDPLMRIPVISKWFERFDQGLETIGRDGSFARIDAAWGHASEAPFRLFKGHMTEGGIRVPAIISTPKHSEPGTVNPNTATVLDVLPTVLDAAGVKLRRETGYVMPTGRSMLPMLGNAARGIHDARDAIGFEFLGHRALIKGDWKLLWVAPPFGEAKWELFNLANDPGEQTDLRESAPGKYEELLDDWHEYVRTNKVIPPQGRFILRPQ